MGIQIPRELSFVNAKYANGKPSKMWRVNDVEAKRRIGTIAWIQRKKRYSATGINGHHLGYFKSLHAAKRAFYTTNTLNIIGGGVFARVADSGKKPQTVWYFRYGKPWRR